MTTDVVRPDIQDAAVRGIIEILLQPEYSTSWVKDLLSFVKVDGEVTDEMAEQVEALMDARLKEMASALVTELDPSRREGLEYLVK